MDIFLTLIPEIMSVATLYDVSDADLSKPNTFISVAKDNITLICPLDNVPEHTVLRDDNWKGFLIDRLDYSENAVILATVGRILNDANISVIVTSDVNTDYIFLKEEDFTKALYALEQGGCHIGH